MSERARTAVVVEDSLDGATLQALGDACARLHAGVQVWNGRRPVELRDRPALVVAGLAAGARQLPQDVIELADRRFPGSDVLLVCNEQLVRPALTLQGGRLTLIEPPATVERMASRIRLLLTAEPAGGVAALTPARGAVQVEEFRRTGWWAAGLTCGGPDGSISPPRAWLGLDVGLTAILTSPAEHVDELAIDRAVELLRDDAGGEERGDELERTLGQHAGLIHLTSDGASWNIYWPCPWQPLWLFSTQRLPRWSNLSQSADPTLWRLPAVSGDVIAGLSSAEGFSDGGSVLPATEVSAAMLDGGPALLALFEEGLVPPSLPFSCVLVEVR